MRTVPYCAAVLPNYDQCLDVGKQTISADLGYISGATPQRPAAAGGSRGVAVLAHGHATTTSSTTSRLSAFGDGLPPCPIELVAEPGQRINFTLFDFAPRNLSRPSAAGQLDYADDNLSKICHRSDTSPRNITCFKYFTKPLRPTQPPVLSGTENEYQPKCGVALRLGSKGRNDSFHLWINVWMTGKTVNTCHS